MRKKTEHRKAWRTARVRELITCIICKREVEKRTSRTVFSIGEAEMEHRRVCRTCARTRPRIKTIIALFQERNKPTGCAPVRPQIGRGWERYNAGKRAWAARIYDTRTRENYALGNIYTG